MTDTRRSPGQRSAMAIPSTGDFSAELELLRRTATTAINAHLNDADLCAICGSAWPCQRVQLAEHNLALV